MPCLLIFQKLLLEDSDIGEDRLAAGMHSPLDVIGGRMLATPALSAAILSDSAKRTSVKAAAYAQGTEFLAANASVAARDDDLAPSSEARHREEKRVFTSRLTYRLPRTDATNIPGSRAEGRGVPDRDPPALPHEC